MTGIPLVYWPRIPLARKVIVERLTAEPDVRLTVVESPEALDAALPGAAGLVLADAAAEVARRVLDRIEATRATFRWMQFVTAGRDGFEAAGMPAGIEVNGPGLGVSPVVAEHAMALLLGLMRQIPAVAEATADADWNRGLMPGMRSLEGRRIAVYGTGRIGGEISRRARAFGAEIVGVSRSGRPAEGFDRVLASADAEAERASFDVVIAALPLTGDTAGMFDAAFFAALKPDAVFVNVARGGVVDQPALIGALRSGSLAGAGLDVTEPEPLPPGDPLWKAPNVLISAHLSGAGSPASQARIGDEILGNFRRLAAAGRFA